jgi:hypothetical protein
VCVPNPCPPPSGACCVGSVCSTQTATDCAGMGGVYYGDDVPCVPNPCPVTPPPCACGGFLNPIDGFYYNTKIYTNTVDNSPCPPDGFCEPAYPEGCPDPGCNNPYGCNDIFTVKTRHAILPVSDTYLEPACDLVTTTEVVEVLATCSHAADIGGGPGCDLFCDGPTGGSNACGTFDPDTHPAFYTTCGTITATITYADPCTP